MYNESMLKEKRNEFFTKTIAHFNVHNRAPVKGTLDDVYEMLPLRFQYLGAEFLYDMQMLHDTDENWDDFGLTETGKVSARLIKNIHLH